MTGYQTIRYGQNNDAAYATRSHTIEPVLGDHKENRGWHGFRRRGLAAVQSEWAFMNASHNLAKLFDQKSRLVALIT